MSAELLEARFGEQLSPLRRRTPLLRRICVLVGTLLTNYGALRAEEAPPPGRDAASAHFSAGNEAFSRGDTHEAYRQYWLAWQLNKAFDVACNLGRAEAELGKLVAAIGHLDFCLDNFSASPQPELKSARARYADLRQTVRAQVAAVRFHVEPGPAIVTLDGVSLGRVSADQDVYLRPGEHVFELRDEGYQMLRRQLVAHAGETRVLELKLEPELSLPAEEAAEPAQIPADRGGFQSRSGFDQRRTLALTGAALTLVGAGVGLGFYLQGRKLDDEASSIRQAIAEDADGDRCAGPEGALDCGQLADTIERRDNAGKYSSLGFVAMGAIGLGTLAVWQWWPAEGEKGKRQAASSRLELGRTDIVPWLNPFGVGVTLSGKL